jgi:hypothetical protein
MAPGKSIVEVSKEGYLKSWLNLARSRQISHYRRRRLFCETQSLLRE